MWEESSKYRKNRDRLAKATDVSKQIQYICRVSLIRVFDRILTQYDFQQQLLWSSPCMININEIKIIDFSFIFYEFDFLEECVVTKVFSRFGKSVVIILYCFGNGFHNFSWQSCDWVEILFFEAGFWHAKFYSLAFEVVGFCFGQGYVEGQGLKNVFAKLVGIVEQIMPVWPKVFCFIINNEIKFEVLSHIRDVFFMTLHKSLVKLLHLHKLIKFSSSSIKIFNRLLDMPFLEKCPLRFFHSTIHCPLIPKDFILKSMMNIQ